MNKTIIIFLSLFCGISSFGHSEARYLDVLYGARFTGMDPLAEESPEVSPYAYCRNNFVNKIDPDGRRMGDYYSRTGFFLYNDGINDNKVYAMDNNRPILLPYTSNMFATTANVIRFESTGDMQESLWIAHAANNAKDNNSIDYRRKNYTLYDQLPDQNYSTTPKEARTPMSMTNNATDYVNARAAVIDVLTGGKDPTGGAVLWDGVDFIQKGLAHNKFREYKSIFIDKAIYNDYKVGVKKYNHKIHSNFIFDSGWRNNIWIHSGKGKYFDIYATGAQGASIFWNIK